MTDWNEPYLKLEQSHKSLKDALNQERYEDAEDCIFEIMNSQQRLLDYVYRNWES